MTEPAPPPTSPEARYPWKEIPGSSHEILLSKARARGPRLRILDLGFGAGELARRLRPNAAYLAGIERDSFEARRALDAFDAPILGDLLEGLRSLAGAPFDVVIAGDVLEHLADPAAALALVRPLLAPDGRLLVSLPNVANVTVRVALLFGRFEYAPRGLLDATHLRFFTRRTGRRLLEAAGFRILDERATAMPVELALPVLGRLPFAPAVRALAVAAARLLPRLFGYQFVWEAARA